MSLTTMAVVGFSLAKIVMRFTGLSALADAADDATPAVARLLRFRRRRLTKALADELAGDLRGLNASGLSENDWRAALESVDQLLNERETALSVQAAVLGDGLWEWMLDNGALTHQRSLAGDAGDYFLAVLRRCIEEIQRRAPASGAPNAAETHLLTASTALSRQLDQFQADSAEVLQRLLDDEPQRCEALDSLLAAAAAYRRELALDDGQYVVRACETELLDSLDRDRPAWPRVIVGDAGAGKSTLLWALDNDLERMGFDPVLVSTAWLMAQPQRIDLLTHAVSLLRERATPVVLLDTVDLMLHQEGHRQTLLMLVEQFYSAGIVALYTTRPDERRLIDHPELRIVELGAYDDSELRRAADVLIARHCPDAVADGIQHEIFDAVARALPAADVCRSPLMLRMVFEAAAPGAPEFRELDVTGLYDAYWERRVIRDARSDAAVGMRPNQHSDVSAVAGTAAAALLIVGLPQERTRKIAAVIGCLADQANTAAVGESLAVLGDRGVISSHDGRVGFFHQTMLEYAFARWWLESSAPDVLNALVERTLSGPGDLFVGAALEQALILAVRDGENAGAACRSLVAHRSGSVQVIALAAWAHRSTALQPASQYLAACDPIALARTARLLPGIAGKAVGQVISQLILIWQASSEDVSRIAVVRALSRVALRDPDTVLEAVEHLYPVGAIPRIDPIVDAADEPGIVRVARNISDRLPDQLLEAFVNLFECFPARHASAIRRLCVSLLKRGGDSQGRLLRYLAAYWQQMGSAELLHEVLATLGFPQHLPVTLLEPCGYLIAEEWVRRLTECGECIDVDEALASITALYGQSSAAFAIGALARQVDGEQLKSVIVRLVTEHGTVAAESRNSLAELLNSHRPAARCFADLTALACEELETQPSALGRDLLDFLAWNQQPADVYLRAFAEVDAADWMRHAELTENLVAAAANGVGSARAALESLAEDPFTADPDAIAALFRAPSATFVPDDRGLEHAIWVAAASAQDAAIGQLLSGPALAAASWARIHERLMGRASSGLPGHAEAGERLMAAVLRYRVEVIEWADARAALQPADDALRTAIIDSLWKRQESDEIDAERIAYLRQLVTVDADADLPIDRADPAVTLPVVTSAARALHYIVARRQPASPDDWSMVRTLTLHIPLNSERYVLGQAFVVMCHYLENLGTQGYEGMPAMLVDLVHEVTRAPFIGLTPMLWRRELVNAVKWAVDLGGDDVVRDLLGAAAHTTADIGLMSVLVEGVAELWFSIARDQLAKLADGAAAQEIRELCQDLVRRYERSAGTRAFPELVPRLTERLRELV